MSEGKDNIALVLLVGVMFGFLSGLIIGWTARPAPSQECVSIRMVE